jgi:diguanylate cyclase (GGDEF)-like protein
MHRRSRRVVVWAVVARLLVVVTLAELAIMLLFSAIHLDVNPVGEALLDAGLLVTLSTPFIYLWIVLPFVVARDTAEEQVRQLALHDPLTGLPNRRLLEESLSQTIRERSRDKNYSALILLDLDGFKPINDTFGHEAGDHVLCTVARRMRAALRDSDLCARLGGDEFVAVLEKVGDDEVQSAAHALLVANKLLLAVSHPMSHNGNELSVGASIGLRLISACSADADALLREADVAMYEAKKAGRSQVKLFAATS